VLTIDGCRMRQERFIEMLERNDLDGALVSDPREIYWLTGLLIERFPALLYVETEGQTWLVSHTAEGEALVDTRETYSASTFATMNPDPMRSLAYEVARMASGTRPVHRLGWQSESLARLMGDVIASAAPPDEWVTIDDQFAALEQTKESDEIDLLREAIDCSLAAYDANRAAIAPGVLELSVLEAGHHAATMRAAEVVYHSGDYRSGQPGGTARDRLIQAGELYVIDAWTTYRGYWSDLCRTFAVGEPSPLQREVFAHVAEIHAEIPARLVPGAKGTELWRWMDGRLREHPHLREIGLPHHAGHGVGLRGHEAPDLNRDREGILTVGSVVCVEPGSYSDELNSGVRLENTFLITESGPQLLSDYPFELVAAERE
jgi:Xaa-Pro dipeptidase